MSVTAQPICEQPRLHDTKHSACSPAASSQPGWVSLAALEPPLHAACSSKQAIEADAAAARTCRRKRVREALSMLNFESCDSERLEHHRQLGYCDVSRDCPVEQHEEPEGATAIVGEAPFA
jgi:hypothetical protein